jgi:plasmid replication initiation protein
MNGAIKNGHRYNSITAKYGRHADGKKATKHKFHIEEIGFIEKFINEDG